MPLMRGRGKNAIRENIRRLRHEGVEQKQAVARAYKEARENPKGRKG